MAIYLCEVCEYIYNEEKTDTMWNELPDEWVCPVCGSTKKYFKSIQEEQPEPEDVIATVPEEKDEILDLKKTMAESESHFSDIREISESGKSIYEPMRTKLNTFFFFLFLIKGAQLNRIPLNTEDPVKTRTIIGPGANQPLIIETPVYIAHMSFGALSREAKIALSKGSSAVKSAICSGEGGILQEELENSYKYIFEYVPNQYSVTEENLKKVDAIEIKIGQSAKPGMGGHLPAGKVTEEIAMIRGSKKGEDIKSPSNFPGIKNKEDLKRKIEWLRKISDGKPIGIKMAAGHIEDDLEIALYAGPDFITLDGRAGGTGSSPKFIKAATSVPTIFALYRARKYFDEHNIKDVSLITTGGLRVSSDFAKALALGADAIAVGTSALIAIGCQQYRVCNTGKCPMGIATQDPDLRRRLNIDNSAKQVENYLAISTEEIKDFARLTGNNNVHNLGVHDLCTTNSEISNHTSIKHV